MPLATTFEEDAQIARSGEALQLRAVQAQHAADEHAHSRGTRLDHQRASARDCALALFEPAPHIASQMLADILAGTELSEVAQRAQTSFEQLALWMDQPHICQRLTAMQKAKARSLHIAALNQSQSLLQSLGRIFESFNDFESFLSLSGSDAERKAHLRNREGLIKAGRTLLAITRFFDPDSTPPASPAPSPASPALAGEAGERGFVGGASKDGGGTCDAGASTAAHRYPATARQREPLPEDHPARLIQDARARSFPAGGGAEALRAGGGSVSSPPFSPPSYCLGSSPSHPP